MSRAPVGKFGWYVSSSIFCSHRRHECSIEWEEMISKQSIKLSKKLLLQNVKRRNFSKKYFIFMVIDFSYTWFPSVNANVDWNVDTPFILHFTLLWFRRFCLHKLSVTLSWRPCQIVIEVNKQKSDILTCLKLTILWILQKLKVNTLHFFVSSLWY